jgi:hypothetical protein
MQYKHSLTACLLLATILFAMADPVLGADRVTLRRGERTFAVDGRVLVEAQDGGLVLMGRDGVLWAVTADELIKHTTDASPFVPLPVETMSAQLLARLPAGFEVHRTAHYLICHDTSPAYARWCGSLFERLYMAFTNYWKRRGMKLTEPEFPLVAVIFADRAAYAKFSRAELGDAAASIIGYFSLRTNRMTMHDLTGMEAGNRHSSRGSTGAQINQILSRPEAARTVATIVHEATHQIAFNCGLHTRYSDCPLWFSEGIAVYFEAPDLSSSRGWRGIGAINQPRLLQFRQFLAKRPADSLRTLIADDKRFRDPKQALDAYAEAWALTYYLILRQPKQFVGYLRTLSEKQLLLQDGPETRLKEFTEAFGDLRELDANFLRYMTRGR